MLKSDVEDHRNGVKTRCRVAIVGAGVAGLCTLRYFGLDPQYDVVAFEQQNRIGGIWNYPDGCEENADVLDTDSRYCRVYRNLRTNSPRPITQMRGFPIADGPETYPARAVVLDYIQKYAANFNLSRFVKFQHRVVSVIPVDPDQGGPADKVRWKISVCSLTSNTVTEDIYDVVFIANGHFNKPFIPDVPEIALYRGPVIHSSAYRTPDPYAGKTVLIIGAGSSGNDLVCELMHIVKKVVVKHKMAVRKFPEKFTTVHEVPHLTSTADGVLLPDGTPLKIDAVILCTGYQFHFPFLSEKCGLSISRGRVAPLYRHMINCRYPSMIFIGLLSGTPFLGAGTEDQIMFCKAYLDGRIEIPGTVEERISECEEDFRMRLAENMPEHRAHMMRKKLWPYCSELADIAQFPHHDPVVEKINAASNVNIVFTPYEFRDYRIEKIDSETFICERLVTDN